MFAAQESFAVMTLGILWLFYVVQVIESRHLALYHQNRTDGAPDLVVGGVGGVPGSMPADNKPGGLGPVNPTYTWRISGRAYSAAFFA